MTLRRDQRVSFRRVRRMEEGVRIVSPKLRLDSQLKGDPQAGRKLVDPFESGTFK
jgi:hypothetical protein